MSEEDLEMIDNNKETALFLAAGIGATRIVELLIKKNKKLVTIPVDGALPIANACHNGHRDTTWFLYSNTPFELLLPENGTFGAGLLSVSLFTKMFDVSLALLRRCPRLAFTKTNFGTIPIVEFSCMSDLFLGSGELPVWKRWIYHGIQVQPTAAPSDVRITVVENGKMQQKNFLPQVFSQL
ncbi:uncharacterized protein LOC110647065 [Hevea brasiliensis]|uniref:uncharacterized protein LOC110647065 n=1 Tax=Hevea brasiliensis TaxID=3981 RepID=UPI0025E49B5A|nr:uncharacterized protein LOC110647065 [Hevea brasiliensis]